MSHAPPYGQVVDAASGSRAPTAETRLGVVTLLAALSFLAGCGSPTPATLGTAAASSSPSPQSTTAAATATGPPTPSAVARSAPAAPAASPAAGAVKLPWPAASATDAAALQKSVDAGSEPWLLDPTEVAMSYASAAHGWTQATAQARPSGNTIEVQQSGRTVVLSLTQPVRTGAGGIWVVTGENALR